jgi:hypothetical protein
MTVFADEDVPVNLVLRQVKQLMPKRNILLVGVWVVKVKDHLVRSRIGDPASLTGAVFVGNDLGNHPSRYPAAGDIRPLLVPLDLLPLLQPVQPVILVRAAAPGIRGEMCHTYPWETGQNNGCGILSQNDSSAQSLYNWTN